jgi:uncharacterized protein
MGLSDSRNMPNGPMYHRFGLPRLGFGMAVVLVLLVLGVQMALGMVMSVIDTVLEHFAKHSELRLMRDPLGLAFVNLVAIGGAVALALHLNRLPPRHLARLGRFTAGQFAAMTLIVLGGGVLLSELDNLFRSLLPPPRWVADLFGDLFVGEGRLFSQVFLIVLVAPVTEEILFRGLILRGLLARHRPAVAVILTAFLFGVLHLNPWQFLSAFCLGVVFGWIYLRTGSVALCIAAHAINNGFFMIVSRLPVEIPGFTGTPDYSVVHMQPLWLDLSGAALLLAGIWLFHKAAPPLTDFSGPEPPVITNAISAGDSPPVIESGSPPPPVPSGG